MGSKTTLGVQRTVTAARKGRLLIAVCGGLSILVAGLALKPSPPELGANESGQAELVKQVRELAKDVPSHRMAVVLVQSDGVSRFAGFDATEHDQFEIGSITKAVTGLLVADSISRGEVTADRSVGDLLKTSGRDVDQATVRQLATHTAGLPSVPQTAGFLARTFWTYLRGTNPYAGQTSTDVIRDARTSGRGEPAGTYSNLGAALLGNALAAHLHRPFPELLHERILEPLGMHETTITPEKPEGVLPDGRSPGGRRKSLWIMDGYAPAGGMRSTPADMTALLIAVLRGKAPGMDALVPKGQLDERSDIGWFWMSTKLTDKNGREHRITWHNGGTGGYASFLGVDLDTKVGVAVLSDVAAPVDEIGFDLLLNGNDDD